MYFFGVHYCARKSCASWAGWAFWWRNKSAPTYLPDIKSRAFLRLLGVECKLIWWEPRSKRQELPADPRVLYFDRNGNGWQLQRQSYREYDRAANAR